MKKVLLIITLSTSIVANADVYLSSGESTSVRGQVIHCGISQPTEKSYSCSVSVCLKSTSNMNTNKKNCEFFRGYREENYSVWAYSGNEAESTLLGRLDSNSDVVDYDSLSMSCF